MRLISHTHNLSFSVSLSQCPCRILWRRYFDMLEQENEDRIEMIIESFAEDEEESKRLKDNARMGREYLNEHYRNQKNGSTDSQYPTVARESPFARQQQQERQQLQQQGRNEEQEHQRIHSPNLDIPIVGVGGSGDTSYVTRAQ